MSLSDYLFGRQLATDEEGEQRVGVLAGIPMLGLDALGIRGLRAGGCADAADPPGRGRYLVHRADQHADHHPACRSSTFLIARRSPRIRTAAGRTRSPRRTWARRPVCSPRRRSCSTTCWWWPSAFRRVSGPWSRRSPCSSPTRSSLCLLILAMITLINLRGVRESGIRIHGSDVPVHHLVAGGSGDRRCQGSAWPGDGRRPSSRRRPCRRPRWRRRLWILMRAFASGCTAMTGVEAVSNGVTAFREPAVPHATPHPDGHHRTAGRHARRHRVPVRRVRDRCDRAGPGGLPEHPVATGRRGDRQGRSSTTDDRFGAGVLALSANTGFADFPRLCRVIAQDGFLPERLCPPGPPSRLFAGHPRPGGAFGGNPGRLRRDHRSFDSAVRRRGISGVHALAGGDGRSLVARRRCALRGSRW